MNDDGLTMLRQKLTAIAREWPAVEFHAEDPNRELIERICGDMGLVAVPSTAVQFRQIRGNSETVARYNADSVTRNATTGEAVEALVGAILTVAPDAPRIYAHGLIHHLTAAGWALHRVSAP